MPVSRPRTHKKKEQGDWRLKLVRFFFFSVAIVMVIRLGDLQIARAGYYKKLSSGQHEFYKELIAERGSIFVKDWKEGGEYIAATNEPRAFVYAEPRRMTDPVYAAFEIGKILGYEVPPIPNTEAVPLAEMIENQDARSILSGVYDAVEEVVPTVIEPVESPPADPQQSDKPNEILVLLERFSKENDPYEPVARNVDEATLERIMALSITGIHYVLESGRSYPEQNMGGHVFGFVGYDADQKKVGNYGIEGYFDDFLSGENGYLNSARDSSGRSISVGSRSFVPARDGGDILLTIDRTVQYVACDALNKAVVRYQADGGSVVILEPSTGRVIAMCSAPDFDPNTYNEVKDFSVYNNRAIFTPYEPGSVFKPIVMAAAIDQGAVSPNTLFNDTGEVKIDKFTIRNSDLKANGLVTMTDVLNNSLNTGMIHVMRLMGGKAMLGYIEAFGFGKGTGIQLNSEATGTISALYNDHEIYYATASFGQGITTTPLQLASAYAAIANGGKLMRPYIVEEQRFPDGAIEKTRPETVRQVISSRAATTASAMMVSVVEEGHATNAQVPGYYVAGKTGTAQVARGNGSGYEAGITNATFVGFGPVENPVFSMVVMLNHPKTSQWASDTSTHVFGEIADFLLHYFEVTPTRPIEE